MYSLENGRKLIGLFIKDNIKINWPQTMKCAKQLLNKYSEIEFWQGLNKYHKKLNNLAFFLRLEEQSNLDILYGEYLEDKKFKQIQEQIKNYKPNRKKSLLEFCSK